MVIASETKDTIVLTQQLITPQVQGNAALTFTNSGSANDMIFRLNSVELYRLKGDGSIVFPSLTASTVPYLDASNKLTSSAVTPTELAFVHGVTSQLSGNTQSATITNKIVDVSANTYTNIVNSNVSTSAAIARSKLAVGTNNRLQINDGSGNLSDLGSLGTTTTVLHGNASGAATYGAVSLTADVSGALPIANGGTANASLAVTNGGMLYTDGTKLVNGGAGLSGQVPISNGTGAFTWGTPLGGLVGDRELNPNPTVDVAITGYVAYADAAAATPADGTGGSPNTTCTYSTSSPITGAGQLLITKAGSANRQGEGCAILTNTLSTADKLPTVEQIDFDYQIVSGTFTAGSDGSSGVASDYEVFVYDVTNGVVVQPLVFKLYSNLKGHFTSWFQTATSATTYRLIFHNATTTTNNFTLAVDNISIHPAKSVGGAPNSISWNGIGPSQGVTGGVTDIALTTSYDSSAAWNGTQYRVPFPGTYIAAGSLTFGTATPTASVYLNSVKFADLTTAPTNANTGGAAILPNLKTGDLISLRVGSSGTISNAIFGVAMFGGASSGSSIPNPVIAASAHVSSAASTNAGNPFNFDTVDFDSTGSLITTGTTTWKFTAPYPGTYHVEAMLNVGGADDILVYKNGAKYRLLSTAAASVVGTGATEVQLNAGDTIFISPGTNASVPAAGGTTTLAQTNHVSIFLIPPGGGGSPAGTVSSSSYNLERTERVSFGGTTEPSACTTSPCTIYRNTPAITSVTRTGAGLYTINFAAGSFSAAPVCVSQQTGFSLAGWTQRQTATVPTTAIYQIQTIVNSTTGDAGAVDVICMGPR